MVPDLGSYNYFIVAFSGGKDSLACLLTLLEHGVPRERIELWHHDVDGREGSELMDWPCTRGYCRAVALALGIKLYFSWLEGGFEREMTRKVGQSKAPTHFEVEGLFSGEVGVQTIGGEGPPSETGRMKFPQVTPDLSKRWCSSSLKIDVGAAALRNQARFAHVRTLVLTGERAAESSARSRYQEFEPDRSDRRNGRDRRHVDHWRPLLRRELGTPTVTIIKGVERVGAKFSREQKARAEQEVWDLIARYGIDPHPAYKLGWGRLSCAGCIFGLADQWASLRAVNPSQFERIAEYERAFGVTIKMPGEGSVVDLANRGRPYPAIAAHPEWVRQALDPGFVGPVRVARWERPSGAFGDDAGPQ